MTIIWEDTTLKLHGKRHKDDRYYFRWHYGKQRVVQMSREYVDKPTERQKSAREAFTELRREVARQLRDAELRSAWMRKFEEDNEGYRMLHTYVYAKLEVTAESPIERESAEQSPTSRDEAVYHLSRRYTDIRNGVETQYTASLQTDKAPILLLYNHTVMPLFLPNKVPKQSNCIKITTNR